SRASADGRRRAARGKRRGSGPGAGTGPEGPSGALAGTFLTVVRPPHAVAARRRIPLIFRWFRPARTLDRPCEHGRCRQDAEEAGSESIGAFARSDADHGFRPVARLSEP